MWRLHLVFPVLLLLPCNAQQPSRSPTAADLTQADIAVMEMVGGSPLLQGEREEVAAAVAEGLRTKPAAWLQGYSNAKVALTLATYHNAFADAQSKENWRRDFENMPPDDRERCIMERHDPVVAVSRGQAGAVTDLVTERSVRALVQAASWAYSGAGLPLPSGFATSEKRMIQQKYDSASPELKSAFAHVDSNFAAAVAFLSETKPGQAQAFLRARLTSAEAGKGSADPGARTALLVQDLYNEVRRRGVDPVKLSLAHSNDPLMQMYTYNAYREAWHTMNP